MLLIALYVALVWLAVAVAYCCVMGWLVHLNEARWREARLREAQAMAIDHKSEAA
jgi:hypothetical protein